MTTTTSRTLFVGGLWFNPNTVNVLSRKLHLNDLQVATLAGEHSLASRAVLLHDRIANSPNITQVIAHSAACLPLAKILHQIKHQVKTVVILNPAPLPGVKFGWNEPLAKLTRKYMWQILRGKDILPSYEEMRTVLGETLTQDLYNSLTTDSGLFLRELVQLQYFARRRPVDVPEGMKVVTYIAGVYDRMLGSTQYPTRALWHGYNNTHEYTVARHQPGAERDHLEAHALEDEDDAIMAQSHVHSLTHLDEMLFLLKEKAGFTL